MIWLAAFIAYMAFVFVVAAFVGSGACRDAHELHHGATMRAAHRDKRLGIDAQIERAAREAREGGKW